MLPSNTQVHRALQVLLDGCPRTHEFWTSEGPTPNAFAVLEGRMSLSDGERTLVLAAFDLWNGHGDLRFQKLMLLDTLNTKRLCTLLLA